MKNAPPLIAPAGKAGDSLSDIYRSHIIYMYRLISRHVSTCWLLFPFYFPSYFYFKFWIFNVKKIRIWIRLNPTWTQKRIQKNFWVRHGLKTDSKTCFELHITVRHGRRVFANFWTDRDILILFFASSKDHNRHGKKNFFLKISFFWCSKSMF